MEIDFKVKGFAASSFDLLHAGHILMLQEARKNCDYLIVWLHTSPLHKNNLIQTVFERYIQLKGCRYVNEIIPYESEEDLKSILKTSEIHIRFLGEDYLRDKKFITGYNTCKERNIKLHYCKRLHHYSSTELKKRIVSMSNTPAD